VSDQTDLLYSYAAIGEYLGVTARQAEHLAAKANLPTFTLGRRVCARKSSLEAWLAKRESGPEASLPDA
jgi:hypothetical protein